MPSIKRRDQKPRSFRGESLGARLVDFLNSENDLRGRRRVISMLADAREIVGNAKRTDNGLFEVRATDQFRRAVDRFNGEVGRYKIVSGFALHSDDRWYFTEQLFRGSRNHSLGEFQAVQLW